MIMLDVDEDGNGEVGIFFVRPDKQDEDDEQAAVEQLDATNATVNVTAAITDWFNPEHVSFSMKP